MPHDILTVEFSIDWPDIGPADIELLSEIIDDCLVFARPDIQEQLEDLRMRMARMLLTACNGDR